MAISQQGSINTTALVVPGLYVQIVPPQNLTLNGVPSNIIGVVGTAQWGPKNTATIVGNMAQYAVNFGAIQNRLNDMGTVVAAAVQQGANSFKCVRVTDGTDTAATSLGVATCVTFTALYTGTLGNSLIATLGTGSKANTWKLTVAIPGLTPEVYDNIAGTGNAFWVALASAVNNGTGISRGPSQLITATSAAGTTAPVAASFTFSGGTDGVTTVTSLTLMGTDGLARTGMYALRGQGCSIGVIADCYTSTAWTTIDGLGQSEGIYMIQVAPPGSAISNGTSGSVDLKIAAGLDSYSTKFMHGDWVWWNDTVNNVIRMISPQGFIAGRLANLSPEQSSLNKPIYGVVGTQKSGIVGSAQQQAYSQADLTSLIGSGIDVIMNPMPGGNYWGAAAGHNSSSNSAIKGDNYTRMTNYIAATLNAGMGIYVGRVVNSALFQNITATLNSFFANMLQQGMLSGVNGIPYNVVCNLTNNPLSRTSLGYVQADASVQYMAINEEFIVNIMGGQTVVIPQSLAAAA
jgi:phage tail sheath protein FI